MALSVKARKLLGDGLKVCRKCGRTMEVSNFPALTYRHNGKEERMYSSPCRDCENAQRRKTRKRVEPSARRKSPIYTGPKQCGMCGAVKPFDKFYKMPNGRASSYCKTCMVNRSTKYKKAKPQVGSQWAKEKRKRVKDAVFAAYGGYKCACCGETEDKFLTLDHINNDGAEFRMRVFGRRTAAGYRTYLYLLKNDFPEGYQVLCMNCNYGKRMNGGVCPHQETCNDHPNTGVESSDSKHAALVH